MPSSRGTCTLSSAFLESSLSLAFLFLEEVKAHLNPKQPVNPFLNKLPKIDSSVLEKPGSQSRAEGNNITGGKRKTPVIMNH